MLFSTKDKGEDQNATLDILATLATDVSLRDSSPYKEGEITRFVFQNDYPSTHVK